HESDVGTSMSLPTKLGQPEIQFFSHAEFRLELVTPDDVLKMGPLRQDAKYFRDRIAALRNELTTRWRDRSPKSQKELIEAAYFFRDAELIDELRKLFDEWTAPTAEKPLDVDFVTQLTRCLSVVGDERDFAAFEQLS